MFYDLSNELQAENFKKRCNALFRKKPSWILPRRSRSGREAKTPTFMQLSAILDCNSAIGWER